MLRTKMTQPARLKPALVTLGLATGLSLGLAPDAEAITLTYNVNATFADSGALSGTFVYDSLSSQVTSISLLSSRGGGFTYTAPPGSAVGGGGSIGLFATSTSPLRNISLNYTALPLIIGGTSNITSGSEFINGSGVSSIATGTITAVPFESNALPVLVAVAFLGGGIWLKRRQAGKLNLELTKVTAPSAVEVS